MKWAVGAALGLLLLVGIYASGKSAGRESEQAKTASILAATASHIADSVAASFTQKFDSARVATAQRIAEADAKTNAAARTVNQAVAGANDAVQRAEALLADSAASRDSLRLALRTDNAAIDSLTATMERERQANVEARQARDSAQERQVALLRAGFQQTLAAKDSAAAKVQLAVAASIQEARGAGIREGRIQTAVVVGALVLGVHFIK